MLRSIISYIWLVASLVKRIPPMLRMGRKLKDCPINAYEDDIHRVATRWAKGIVFISGARLHIDGIENIPKEGAVLFVANHQSDFDIALFLTVVTRPIGFVAKIEMLKVPVMRTWMAYMRCVFIDRKDIRQSAKTILEGIEILKSGHSMVLFPEGTRSKSDNMLPFKPGGFKLATKSKSVIVPATIRGSYKIFEENHYKVTPADVYITFHPPVPTADLDAEALAALPQQVEATIKAGLTAPLSGTCGQ